MTRLSVTWGRSVGCVVVSRVLSLSYSVGWSWRGKKKESLRGKSDCAWCQDGVCLQPRSQPDGAGEEPPYS